MDRYEQLDACINSAAEAFKKVDTSETIRIVSHLDSDGICACSILIRALTNENRKYSISIVHQLEENILRELSHEDYKTYVFTDLGSGQISNIKRFLPGRSIFILDHHELSTDKNPEDIVHINPHLFGIDGSREISGAGITYKFVMAIDPKNREMAHIAIVGAIGDLQEENGFKRLNDEILSTAKENGKIKVTKGLRVFGSQTRPIHKVIEYTTDPYIPGVTGSESAAIQFLQQIDINPKKGKEWKKLCNLTEEEQQKLACAIILKRSLESHPEDIFGYTYLLTEEAPESPLKDAKEFSTLLNACGRMNKASLGIGTCIGNKDSKQKAVNQLFQYRKELIAALKWYQDNKKSELVHQEKGFILINAKDHIPFTFAGTIASILSKSNEFEDKTYILSMAYTLEGTIKASLRISGRKKEEADLKSILQEIIEKVGGESGGHTDAAGAIVPIEKEEEFLSVAIETLRQKSMEEKVL
ncbi:MAG: DHH family phosphoesterase [Candidatus Woesearchaeota archaeon]